MYQQISQLTEQWKVLSTLFFYEYSSELLASKGVLMRTKRRAQGAVVSGMMVTFIWKETDLLQADTKKEKTTEGN